MSGFVITPDNPAPPGGTCRMLRTADGRNIRAAWWPAASEAARGTVVLFNGHTEFIEKYFEVIGELTARGFAVATLDWRGQGLSDRLLEDRLRSHANDFADFAHDVSALLEQVVHRECPRPVMLLAHSLGGHLGLRAMRDHPETFERAVLMAPFTAFRAGPASRAVLKMVSALARWTGRAERRFPLRPARTALDIPFAENEVTRDEARYARTQEILRAEPRLLLNGITWGWLEAALRSQDEIHGPHFMPTIRAPILVVSAEKEALVSSRDHVRLAAVWPNVRRILIEDAWHEVLMERDPIRARFWAEFDAFT
ncbi:MAG: alpha/beta fold hydrolase, partial [Alphaproteobacteria bacterium]